MRPMDSRDVDRAVAEMVRVLAPHESADWRRAAGTLGWSCWETAAHVATAAGSALADTSAADHVLSPAPTHATGNRPARCPKASDTGDLEHRNPAHSTAATRAG